MNLLQFHNVFMVKFFHYFNPIYKTLFSFLLRQQVFFRESLYSISLLSVHFFNQINSGKRSLTDHFNGVELRVEITLQKHLAKMFPPNYEVILRVCSKISVPHISHKSDTVKNILVVRRFFKDVVTSNPLSSHKS